MKVGCEEEDEETEYSLQATKEKIQRPFLAANKSHRNSGRLAFQRFAPLDGTACKSFVDILELSLVSCEKLQWKLQQLIDFIALRLLRTPRLSQQNRVGKTRKGGEMVRVEALR